MLSGSPAAAATAASESGLRELGHDINEDVNAQLQAAAMPQR